MSITIMMLVLLFMFQGTQVYRDREVQYKVNEYLQDVKKEEISIWDAVDFDITSEEGQYVLFVGETDGSIVNTVKQWCDYTKRKLVMCSDLDDFTGEIGKNQEYVLVQSTSVNKKSVRKLNDFAEEGVGIVFCDLPDADAIEDSAELKKLLGIRQVYEKNVVTTGIRLFSGFLLGGEAIYQAEEDSEEYSEEYQDLTLEMPWYILGEGTQTYMVGLIDETEMEQFDITREELPAVVWSRADGESKIFAVNGDYLEDSVGIGILDAIDAKMQPYTLYPVLNAQLLTVVNFPGLADENADVMEREFSSSMTQVSKDIVYPQLVASVTEADFDVSCMIMPQYDYNDENQPQPKEYEFMLRALKEMDAEVGISLDRNAETKLEEKIQADEAFWESANNEYVFGAAYAGADKIEDIVKKKVLPEEIRTIVFEQDKDQPLISVGEDGTTLQAITNDACDYSFRNDLKQRSIQTALGYSNVLLDMNQVFWPEDGQVHWKKFCETFSANLNTYWKKYQQFEDVTVSENDTKIRDFLSMDYSHERQGDTVSLEIDTNNQSSFIFRIQGEAIGKISGGTFVELEEDVYLIHTASQSVEIQLEPKNIFSK